MPIHRHTAVARRVVLVGWEGADWKVASPLIDAGKLPQLANAVQNGVSGPLTSLPPYVSPLVWTSMATGKTTDQHGISHFTTVDEATGKNRVTQSYDRRAKAFWTILKEQGMRASVVGWPMSHPAEASGGIIVSDAYVRAANDPASEPVPSDAVSPAKRRDDIVGVLMRPTEIDGAFLDYFWPALERANATSPRHQQVLAQLLAELYTTHYAVMAALEESESELVAVYYSFLGDFARAFAELILSTRSGSSPAGANAFNELLGLAYSLQDLLLRDLLVYSGPNATVMVCSGHSSRPEISRSGQVDSSTSSYALWQHSQGMLVAAGPGIARDTLIAGASILDVVPTILHLLGLPSADDMDGKVLREALSTKDIAGAVSTYESGDSLANESAGSDQDELRLLEQLARRGDISLDVGPFESAEEITSRENRWNLSIALRYQGKDESALTLLEQLHWERPEDTRYAAHLALCQASLALNTEALATAETLLDVATGNFAVHALLAEIAVAAGEPGQALNYLEAAEKIGGPQDPVSLSARWVQCGAALLALDRVAESAARYHAATQLDPASPAAWLGYARTLLRGGYVSEAETCAREAVAIAPTLFLAFFILGESLAAQKKDVEAREAFAQTLKLQPRFLEARQAMATLMGKPYVAEISDVSAGPVEDRAGERLRVEARSRSHVFQANLAERRRSQGSVFTFETNSEATRGESAWIVRAPWPDELARAASAFPGAVPYEVTERLILIAFTHGQERIVGVAGLQRDEGTRAALLISMRPRFFQSLGCEYLFAAVRQRALELGISELIIPRGLASEDPMADVLAREGFEVFQSTEVWRTSAELVCARVERLHAKLKSAGKVSPYVAMPLAREDLSELRLLLTEENLLLGEGLTLQSDDPQSGFSSVHSFVVRDGGKLAGAFLARLLSADTLSIDAEVVAAPWRRGVDWVHLALFHASMFAARERGIRDVFYSVQREANSDTARLARRSDSQSMGVRARWRCLL